MRIKNAYDIYQKNLYKLLKTVVYSYVSACYYNTNITNESVMSKCNKIKSIYRKEIIYMSNKTHCLNYIFREDRKAFIMAMDHGSIFNIILAMKHPGERISEVARAGADAALKELNKGFRRVCYE